MTAPGIPAYDADLRAALAARDWQALRDLMRANNTIFQIPDDIFEQQDDHWWEVLVHKLTLARPDLYPQHRESTEWLSARGYTTDLGGY